MVLARPTPSPAEGASMEPNHPRAARFGRNSFGSAGVLARMGSRISAVENALRQNPQGLLQSELVAMTGLYRSQVGLALKSLERFGLARKQGVSWFLVSPSVSETAYAPAPISSQPSHKTYRKHRRL